MGSFLSRHRGASEVDLAEDAERCSATSSRDALTLLAAEHWLTLDQLHYLFIADHAHTTLPPFAPALLSCTPSHLLTSSPTLSPASASKCTAKRHAPHCCCSATTPSSSSSFHSPHDPPHLSLSPAFQPFSLEPTSLPPPSPADVSVLAPPHHPSSYRSPSSRSSLYLSAIRPLLHSTLLSSTPLCPDALSLTLAYALDPPTLTPPQLVSLALLSPQHLHPYPLIPPTLAPSSPSFSDLVLSDSGCFVHRRGVVDRARSMRAQGLRLNFVTLHKGLWRLVEEAGSQAAERVGQGGGSGEQLRLDVYGMEEYYFDQRLHREKAHRMACMRIAPYDDGVAEECSRNQQTCLCNQLLVVCGDVNSSG